MESTGELGSRLATFGKLWIGVANFIQQIFRSDRLDDHLFRRIDQGFRSTYTRDEMLLYAKAWLQLSERFEDVPSPSMFGHEATSFHGLVSEIALWMHSAIDHAITESREGTQFTFYRQIHDGRAEIFDEKNDLIELRSPWVIFRAIQAAEVYSACLTDETVRQIQHFLDLEEALVSPPLQNRVESSLSADSILAMLEGLRSQFVSARFSGLRLAICHEATGELLGYTIGCAVERPEKDGAIVDGLPRSENSLATVGELSRLFETSGTMLNRVPNFGVVSHEWKERIEREDRAAFRWVAFLTTGTRRIHFHEHTVNSGWIDDAARVSAMAIQDLISAHLASCERPAVPVDLGNATSINVPTDTSTQLSAGDIAKELGGMSVKQVTRWAKSCGIKTNTKGVKTHRFGSTDVIKILKHAATKASNDESKAKAAQILAERFGVTVTHLDTK